MPHSRVESIAQPRERSSIALWMRPLPSIVILVLTATAVVSAAQPPELGSHFDRRAETIAEMRVPVAPTMSQAAAIADLRSALPDLRADIEPSTGATQSLTNATGYLTEAATNESFDPATIARDFAFRNHHLLGLDFEDLDGMELADRVYSRVSGATHFYYRQVYLGIPVYNAQLQIHVNAKGRILGVDNGFLPGLRNATQARSPRLDASDAVAQASRHLGLEAPPPRVIDREVHSPQQRTHLEPTGISTRPIETELMWLPIRQGDARLVWRFQLSPLASPSVFDMTVDATSGEVWTRFDWTSQATYRVFPQPVESPMLPTPFIPRDTRVLAVDPDLRAPNASPDGWHRILGATSTIMRGNNVHAYEDRNRDNAPPGNQANCGVNLVCDFPFDPFDPPERYTNAAVTNLFYWTNLVHDIQYQYGFDEQAGNFQVANFGRGGLGNDAVLAQAQDGSALNNGFFSAFPDGQSPLLRMHEFTWTNPRRDADLDSLFIVHEYGHGVSQRQVGGPANVGCLQNAQQMGEGWSDWLGLVYTADPIDHATTRRGIFNYVLGMGPIGTGARSQAYSTDPAINTFTYQNIVNAIGPHAVGAVWAQALWEVYWSLVNVHGFDADLYEAFGGSGNQRAMLYVNEGMKSTACGPSFLQARDGVLRAATDNYGGEDLCRVWEAFAAFGLGINATSGSSTGLTNIHNGFNKPVACCTTADNLPTPAFISTNGGDVCQNESGLFRTSLIAGANDYTWQLLNTHGQLVRSQTTLFPTWILHGHQVGVGQYTLRVRANNECGASNWRSSTVLVLSRDHAQCSDCPAGNICPTS